MKSAIKGMLRRVGWQLLRVDETFVPRHDAYEDQKALFAKHSPQIILDIGANLGQTAQRYRSLFSGAGA